MWGLVRASPASSSVCSTCRSAGRTRMSSVGRFRRRPRLRSASRRRRAQPLHGPALEPLRPILAVRLDEGVGDGMDEVGVRRHVVLPCRKAAPCRFDGSPPNPSEAPSVRSPRLRTAARRASHVAGRGTLWCREWLSESSEAPQTRPRRQHAPAEGARLPARWPGERRWSRKRAVRLRV